jgi:ATP-dependent Lhr-like helicase
MNPLPHTWDALLARFGRFTDIQERAIEPLLAGRNCVLVAATASGKTEAALAPLLERQLQQRLRNPRQPPLQTLYLVPTRALAQDLRRRLEQPVQRLGLRLTVKTGDEPAWKASQPPDVLLTTPESFDSMLANRPRSLKDVRAVILDELHLYEDTARGDQLRVLLNRLRRLRKFAHTKSDAATSDVQFFGLSETVDEPETVAARYFIEPLAIIGAGRRAIDAEFAEWHGPESLRELFGTLAQRGVRKVLAFCQSRNECEELAYIFRGETPFGERVYAHHAHLAARLRQTVEEQFATLDVGLCFATATLELGIDIGNVDLIVLLGPPPDVASFLQRIGRGNRRTKRTNVACFYRNEREFALFRVFHSHAQRGESLLTNADAPFRPSVVAQQLFSYVKQTHTNEIEPRAAYELFQTPQGAPLLTWENYSAIVDKLLADRYFVSSFGTLLKPGEEWEKLYERREIYSNLGSAETVELVDEMTGRRLGFMEHTFAPGTAFLFGGQTRRATHQTGRKLFVKPTAGPAEKKPRWATKPRPLAPSLVRALALEMGLPVEDKVLPFVFLEDSEEDGEATEIKAVLLHCAGRAYGLVLGDWLERSGACEVIHCDELSLTFDLKRTLPPLEFSETEIAVCVQKRWQQFESGYAPGRWHKLLPHNVRSTYVVAAFQTGNFRAMFLRNELRRQ